jgi:hypothetical protein
MLDRVFELTRGEVDSEVTHLKKRDDRFQIRSPSVVAGVRGTLSRELRRRRQCGHARRSARRHGRRRGQAATGRRHARACRLRQRRDVVGTVGAPIPLLPAPALAHPDKVQDEPDIAFDVVPLEHANAYHLQLGATRGCCSTCSAKRAPSRRARSSRGAERHYFVRVAAIDDNGLEGHAAPMRSSGADGARRRARRPARRV